MAFAMARRFFRNLLVEDHSLAGALLIGLLTWTVQHLVDTVAQNGTVEYSVRYLNAQLASHQHVYQVSVRITNLSHDTPIPSLEVSIQNPHPDNQATFFPSETACTFDSPSWAASAVCEGHADGGELVVPLLVPGTSIGFNMKFLGAIDAAHRPIVRIRPGQGVTNFRLIEPGVETFLTRHETELLAGLAGVALILFFLTVSAAKPAKAVP